MESCVKNKNLNKKSIYLRINLNLWVSNCSAVFSHKKKSFLGGHDGKEYLQSMERFDPVTSEWTVVSSMPSVRSGIGVSAIKNKIYVFGGHNGTKYLDSALKYDPVNDVWSELGNMTNARCYMAITDVWKNSS